MCVSQKHRLPFSGLDQRFHGYEQMFASLSPKQRCNSKSTGCLLIARENLAIFPLRLFPLLASAKKQRAIVPSFLCGSQKQRCHSKMLPLLLPFRCFSPKQRLPLLFPFLFILCLFVVAVKSKGAAVKSKCCL